MRLRLLLAVSLVFNVFLGVSLYVAVEPFHEEAPPESPGYIGTVTRTNVVVRRENFTWEQVTSTNYLEFVKNLRAVGCPEQTVRDIVMTEINRIYARRRVTDVVYPNYQWWRSDPDPDIVAAADAKLRSIEAERRNVLTSLLASGWEAQNKAVIAARAGITLTGPILGDLSDSVKEAVFASVALGQEKIEAYQEEQARQGKPVDPMEMVRLREEPFVSVVRFLQPVEYDEFVLRYSPAAQELREEMRGMDLTPDQFRGVFNVVGAILGQPVYYYTGDNTQLLLQQKQLQAQSQALIKTALGATVYGAYQLNLDPLYRASRQTVEQLGVPAADIAPLYEINRATQAEMNRIRNDATLSNDEKVEALAQTQVQQQQSLEQLLGATAFQKWLQSQGPTK